jgi:uncharacterized protein YciI
MHYILTYELAPDYLERRGQYRDSHLALAWEYADRGDIVIAGAVGDPIDCAMLVFGEAKGAAAEAFARADPYVKNGLVTAWTVKPWNTVVGTNASNPIRPG